MVLLNFSLLFFYMNCFTSIKLLLKLFFINILRFFEDNERSMPDLKLFFFRTLLDWLSSLRNQSFSSFLDFLDLCNFCT